MNVRWETLFKGAYITAVELEGKTATLTISDVDKEMVADPESGKEREKGIIHFRETDRGWVLNRTNATCLAAMFGPMTGAWSGKRVTLYATPVQVGPKRELGIRIKGSPDIDGPVDVEIKLPRRKPIQARMERTTPTGGKPARRTQDGRPVHPLADVRVDPEPDNDPHNEE